MTNSAVYPKGKTTAEKILDAAFASIATHGCGSVTLRGIAKEAGVALSQLSYYYGNKESLFVAVLKRMQEDYASELIQRLQKTGSVSQQIKELIEYNKYILTDRPETYRNFLEFFNVAMSSATFRTHVDAFTTNIATIIENRINYNELAKDVLGGCSPQVITRFILSAAFGISLQHLLNPENQDILSGFTLMLAMLEKELD